MCFQSHDRDENVDNERFRKKNSMHAQHIYMEKNIYIEKNHANQSELVHFGI